MVKVLFVCLGNICRSPSAEAIFRSLVMVAGLEQKIHIDSAGTGAWHVGNSPDERAQAAGKRRNILMADLRSRQASLEDFSSFNYILAMDRDNLNNLVQMRPSGYEGHLSLVLDFSGDAHRDVPDPYYGEIEDYETVFNLLEPALKGLLSHIRLNDNLN